MLFKDLVVFVLLSLTANVYTSSVPPKIANLIYEWGPLVKLPINEPWKPSSVDYFLAHTKMDGCSNQPEPMTVYNLQKCNSDSYLTTKESISCPSCTEPAVLRGQHPSVVPVYVLYREHKDFLEAAYRMFFPYNRGKRVCIGYYAHNICPCFKVWGNCVCPRIRGCVGGYSTFGHHVGDWENVIVRFRKVDSDYQIYSMYLSTHNTEITNKFAGEFLWKDGKFTKGSQSLAMHGGTKHAIVYSAEGSHGIWPAAGRHVYKTLPNKDELVDYTSDGLSWHTWENLKIVKYDPSYHYSGEFKFMEFDGRWGNREQGCGIIEFISGECMLNNGPTGPAHKGWPNFGY